MVVLVGRKICFNKLLFWSSEYWWCVTKAEYGLCDAKIIVIPQLQSMTHSQSQINQQTDAQARKTYKEKASCFSDVGERSALVALSDYTNDRYNTRTFRPWLQGAFEILNHSVICLPSGPKAAPQPLVKFANKLQNSEKPFFWKKYLKYYWWLKTTFNVFLTMRAHVYIGLEI